MGPIPKWGLFNSNRNKIIVIKIRAYVQKLCVDINETKEKIHTNELGNVLGWKSVKRLYYYLKAKFYARSQ